jgi:phenylpyruvate tautomerase PptA (4-oxalocrotonate tautomerase family)
LLAGCDECTLARMPLVTIHTSVPTLPEEKVKTLLQDLSPTVARILGKPERYMMTCLVPRSAMTFAGSTEPSCYVEIKSIGNLTRESAAALTEAVSKLVTAALGVPADRTFVVCADVPGHLWGFDGSTLG